MRKQPSVTMKWRNIEVQVVGFLALVTVIAVAISSVAVLAITHAIGCDVIHLCS